MTEKIEKLILYREIEGRLNEIEHLDYPIRKAELQQLKEILNEKIN